MQICSIPMHGTSMLASYQSRWMYILCFLSFVTYIILHGQYMLSATAEIAHAEPAVVLRQGQVVLLFPCFDGYSGVSQSYRSRSILHGRP
jgi:hypothetical protein